jgi:hypothetical protein
MMALQLAFGAVLAVLAALQLRPIFRRQEREGGIRALRGLGAMLRGRSRWRIVPRPGLADSPMLWKELHTGGPRGFARLVGLLLTMIGGSFLGYYAVWLGSVAIAEMWEHGYYVVPLDYLGRTHRWEFYWFLRLVSPLLYVAAVLSIAGAAAASITSEHEEDTWVSLTTTDLTGREILVAKLRGAVKRGHRLAGLIVLLAIVGVAAGSIDVLSVPALIFALAVYGWFAAALGVWISLHLRSTWRAQFLTVAGLLLINVVGQGVLNISSQNGFGPQIWPGFTPSEISKLVLEPSFVWRFSGTSWPHTWRISAIDDSFAWQTISSALSLCGYGALAGLLFSHAVRRFDTIAGRARRTKTPPTAVVRVNEVTVAST